MLAFELQTFVPSESPVPHAVVRKVNALLFAPDPPSGALEGVEVCVVLGSRNCAYKAERAAELFGAREGVTFVACGGNPSTEGVLEAELIRSTLTARGVDARRVLVDDVSTDTASNLVHAARLIRANLGDPSLLDIAFVSSGFHRRYVLASLPPEFAHSTYVSAIGPSTGPDTWHRNAMGRAVIMHELLRPS